MPLYVSDVSMFVPCTLTSPFSTVDIKPTNYHVVAAFVNSYLSVVAGFCYPALCMPKC